jgi:hypothetical protein
VKSVSTTCSLVSYSLIKKKGEKRSKKPIRLEKRKKKRRHQKERKK